jgi:hypothetical protein
VQPVGAQSTVVAEFTVHAGEHERVDTPVMASLGEVPLQERRRLLESVLDEGVLHWIAEGYPTESGAAPAE